MTRGRRCGRKWELTGVAGLILVAVLIGSRPGTAGRFEDSGARTFELARLRAQADWIARRSADAAPRSTSAQLDAPRYLDTAPTRDSAPPARPYLGQRVVTMQRSAAEIERRLDRGDTAAAARLLQAVESDVATLRAVFSNVVAEDPNMIALKSQIGALEHRLEGD